jgi:hypothetical protein
MELSSNLLNAMVQSAETDTLAQIRAGSSGSSTALAQGGLGANGQAVNGQTALTLASQPPGLNVTGQAGAGTPGQPIFTVGGQGGPGPTGQTAPGTTQSGAGQPGFGQPGLTVAGQTGGAGQSGQSGQSGAGQSGLGSGQFGPSAGQPGFAVTGQAGGPGATGQPGQGIVGPGGVGLQPGTTVSLAGQSGLPALMRASPSADTYYGSEAPASPSLLSQSGVGAYIQLLNAFASHEASDKTANLVTNNLGTAAATLKAAFTEAAASLPPQLQQKDWGFSVSNGALVFTQGKDALSTQDLADLQKAFAGANVEFSAREVAAALTDITQRRQVGADSGSLAWGAVDANDNNFKDVVNLRTYVSTTAPGSNYHPNTTEPAVVPPQIPNLLGGMDLRDLVSARPNFFRPDGHVVTETPDEPMEDATATVEEAGPLQGQCSCGQVRFTVDNSFEYAFFCHCSRCRTRTGSAFAAIAGIGIDKVQVTAGSDDLLIEGECSDGYGARCARCHAFLFAAVRERQYMHVSLGVLDGMPNRLPDHHIYVASKARWFEITDDLPQYDELPVPRAPQPR